MEVGDRYSDFDQRVEALDEKGGHRVRISFSPETEVPVKLPRLNFKFTGIVNVPDRSGDPSGNIVDQTGGGQLMEFQLIPTEEDYVYKVYMIEVRKWQDSAVLVTPYVSNPDPKSQISQLETLFMIYEGGEFTINPADQRIDSVKSQMIATLIPLLKAHPKFMELLEATKPTNV